MTSGNVNHIAFYGTLMSKAGRRGIKAYEPTLTLLGDTTVEGQLFDVGAFPALIPGEGRVKCELYRMNEGDHCLQRFDMIEGFRNGGPGDLYVRKAVAIEDPNTGEVVSSWIYFFNQSYENLKRIPSGDWMNRHDKIG